MQAPCFFEVSICLEQSVSVLLQFFEVLLAVLEVPARVNLSALKGLNNLSFNHIRRFTVAPASKVALAIIRLVNAKSMLFVVEPGSEIFAFVLIRINAVAMLVVLLEEAFVLAGVRPLKNAVSALNILNPVSYVLPTIGPLVMAEPMDLVVHPVANVLRAI